MAPPGRPAALQADDEVEVVGLIRIAKKEPKFTFRGRTGETTNPLYRGFGNQEAASKRLSRLLHNPRIDPRHVADAVLLQALHQLPSQGKIRLALDWTIEGQQHLFVGRSVV